MEGDSSSVSIETKPVYIVPLKVTIMHTDMFGHVNNVSYAAFMETSRFDFFIALGINLREEMAITRTMRIDYLTPATLFDPLVALITVTKIGRTSLEMDIDIVNRDDHSIIYSKGRVAQVHCCAKTGESRLVSDAVKNALREIGQFS